MSYKRTAFSITCKCFKPVAFGGLKVPYLHAINTTMDTVALPEPVTGRSPRSFSDSDTLIVYPKLKRSIF